MKNYIAIVYNTGTDEVFFKLVKANNEMDAFRRAADKFENRIIIATVQADKINPSDFYTIN